MRQEQRGITNEMCPPSESMLIKSTLESPGITK